MAQGILPFKYQISEKDNGLTAMAGLPTFFELAFVLGMVASIEKHIKIRGMQGWLDVEMIMGFVLLSLAGGDHVEDLDRMEADEGACEVMRKIRTHRMSRKQRRKMQVRWRKGKERTFPSRSAGHRYLKEFHDEGEEKKREAAYEAGTRAFIPTPNEHLQALPLVNADLLAQVQRYRSVKTATLDQDATLVFSNKQEAKYSYKGPKAYQPFNTWWAEQQLMVHTEQRDGNVPAGHQQLRCLKESLACLPPGVEEVFLRSDTAAYQHDLLRYCADGKNERFGVIQFAICCDVTAEFKKAVSEVRKAEWQRLHRQDEDGTVWKTNQEWAEVCFVPNETAKKKDSPTYRYLAIRETLSDPELPGLEKNDPELPFPTIDLDKKRYKLFGVVTNMDWQGERLFWWQRERCGKSEEVHDILKNDLAGGIMPSGYFGSNAAWWWIAVLSFNLLMAMKQLVLKEAWVPKRMKAIRFDIINVPGRVVHHAGYLIIKLTRRGNSFDLLTKIRQGIAALLPAPAT
ncbi:MAG: transposase [Candidatus Eisenbacteria bacterium]